MTARQPPGATVKRMLDDILGGEPSAKVTVSGEGGLPSVFPVTELATASVAATGVALSELLATVDGRHRPVNVDRRLASMWFSSSLRPQGWAPPPAWDPISGDYETANGWIRLHTNVPAHRNAALKVLDTQAFRGNVAESVAAWRSDELESAITEAGGCAASMHTLGQWRTSEPGLSVAQEPLIRWEDTGEDASTKPFQPDPGRPLQGVRVLDLTRVLAGPVATRWLAMLGAEVLRIDPPWWDEPGLVPDIMYGKRSARLDLQVHKNREQLLELLAGADVLVHGYRPGALESLNLGQAVRLHTRPGLIEVALDAYGWSGPWSRRRGFDSLVQMSCGIADAGMRILGRDNPTPLPVQGLDHATGYLMAYAVIRALTHKQNTGRGESALLSLARTAHLLTSSGASQPPHSLRFGGSLDVSSTVEQTSWGKARRLVPPLSVEGVQVWANIPARSIGSDSATWSR